MGITGARPVYTKYDDKKGKIEILNVDSKKAVVVSIKSKDMPEPVEVCIMNSKCYAPCNGFARFESKGIFLEFYAKLFPIDRVASFDILFIYDEKLYAVPAQKMMAKGEHTMTVNDDFVDKRIYVSFAWCQQFKLFK